MVGTSLVDRYPLQSPNSHKITSFTSPHNSRYSTLWSKAVAFFHHGSDHARKLASVVQLRGSTHAITIDEQPLISLFYVEYCTTWR